MEAWRNEVTAAEAEESFPGCVAAWEAAKLPDTLGVGATTIKEDNPNAAALVAAFKRDAGFALAAFIFGLPLARLLVEAAGRDLLAVGGDDSRQMLATEVERDEIVVGVLASGTRGLGGVRGDGLRLCGLFLRALDLRRDFLPELVDVGHSSAPVSGLRPSFRRLHS